MDTSRVVVCDAQGNPIIELGPDQLFGRTRTEELNGEHSLSLTTTRVLSRGQRVLTCDATGKWREYVVKGEDADHSSGRRAIGTYYCVWSLQSDLTGSTVSRMPGTETPVLASVALDAVLSGTARWVKGTVTQTTTGGASMYRMSAWEAMSVLVKTWGGEIDATVEVGSRGVTARRVHLLAHQGSTEAVRRFDWGRDLTSVKRKVADAEIACRIVPLGKGEETEGGGHGRKIDITSVNDGKDYLQNDDTAPIYRLPDGSGGWEYPTKIVENSDIEDPQELKDWGLEVLEYHTVPQVTYTASVVQLAEAGMDVHGIGLGDEVQVVDRGFAEGVELRLSGRVVKLVTNELDPSDIQVTLGTLGEGMSDLIAQLDARISRNTSYYETLAGRQASTADYLAHILDHLNEQINADGGYTYITDGEGIVTYDRPVTDPTVGREATKAVQIKGGGIRIADSKDDQGEWEWRTVFVTGHIAAEFVTTVNVTAGFIGSPSGNYWNLDSGEFRMASTALIADRTAQEVIDGIDATVTGVDVEYAESQSATVAPVTGWSTTAPAWREGWFIWQRTATTTADGTAYSTPAMISGRDGHDGAAGAPGEDGVGVDSVTVSYGISQSASAQPASWGTTAPTSFAQGDWLWVRTETAYTDGSGTTTYSKSYVGTDGQDGADGTSVTILGSYATVADLQRDHPTGTVGDAYIVAGDLYVWDGAQWANVGQIQGPAGTAGRDGTSVTVSAVEYGTSASDQAQPSSWATTVPALSQGAWLWVRTTYSDGTSATTKSYVGTDGSDGASVYVQSSTKVGDTTTVVIADTEGHTSTLTIVDGADGSTGTPGASGYVHTAWANSSDGTADFSTSVSQGKSYLGVYTDNTAADSEQPSAYSWSLIKGADGTDGSDGTDGLTAYVHTAWANSEDGSVDFSTTVSLGKSYLGVYSDFQQGDSSDPSDYAWSKIEGEAGTDGSDGVGVSAIIEQYYLSTSADSQTGGSWKTTPDMWVAGRWYWTRSQVTWTDGTVTTTAPVLARGLNVANRTANEAKTSAANAQTAADAAAQAAQAAQATADSATTTLATVTGDNVLPGSGNISVVTGWEVQADGGSTPTLSKFEYFTIPAPTTALKWPGVKSAPMAYSALRGREVTLSFTVTPSGGSTVDLNIQADISHNAGDGTFTRYRWGDVKTRTAYASGRHSITFTMGDSFWTAGSGTVEAARDLVRICFYDRSQGVGCTIKEIKLEFGASASAWRAGSNEDVLRAYGLTAERLDELDTQEGIFNTLTNNGETQGLYLQNGKVYINASYITSGVLNASLIGAGVIDASYIQAGTMSAERIDTTNLVAPKVGPNANNYVNIGDFGIYHGLGYHQIQDSSGTVKDTGFYVVPLSQTTGNAVLIGILDNNNTGDMRAWLGSDKIEFQTNPASTTNARHWMSLSGGEFKMQYELAAPDRDTFWRWGVDGGGMYLQNNNGKQYCGWWPE